MLISVSSQHPGQKNSGIAAGVRLGTETERASAKQPSPDEHRVESRMVSSSHSQPLGMISPGRENCQKQEQKGKVGKFWIISSIMGNGSAFRVAVEQKPHLWLPVSSLYRDPSQSVPGPCCLSQRQSSWWSAGTGLLHLWPSGYGTAEHQEVGYKILLWPHLHMALGGQSPPYSAMTVLSGFVECEPGFTDAKEQANI